MASRQICFLDTNILLRLSDADQPRHQQIADSLALLQVRGTKMCCAMQNIAEYWNVSTRSTAQNGLGLTVAETAARLLKIMAGLDVLPEPRETYQVFFDLLVAHQVRGIQVHDARLTAVMIVNGVSQILTLNDADFARYAGITAMNPRTFAQR